MVRNRLRNLSRFEGLSVQEKSPRYGCRIRLRVDLAHIESTQKFKDRKSTSRTRTSKSSINNTTPNFTKSVANMSDVEVEVEAVQGYQVLPKEVVEEIGSIKLFNKWYVHALAGRAGQGKADVGIIWLMNV
jgi:hypothetical protein